MDDFEDQIRHAGELFTSWYSRAPRRVRGDFRAAYKTFLTFRRAGLPCGDIGEFFQDVAKNGTNGAVHRLRERVQRAKVEAETHDLAKVTRTLEDLSRRSSALVRQMEEALARAEAESDLFDMTPARNIDDLLREAGVRV